MILNFTLKVQYNNFIESSFKNIFSEMEVNGLH